MRLRPRESTWLDTLLAVDKGCLVRTRPVCMRKREIQLKKTLNNTAVLPMLTQLSTYCLQLNEEEKLRSTTADEKLRMLEAAERTSDLQV